MPIRFSSQMKDTSLILKEIITIIMALAFAQAIAYFLVGQNNQPLLRHEFTPERILTFICVITAIVRFYHGNVGYISRTYDVPDHLAIARRFPVKLTVDFLFIFLQSILFCVLSVYQTNYYYFYALFTVLLLFDSLWFFVLISYSRSVLAEDTLTLREIHRKMGAMMNWMVVNFITSVVMLIILLPQKWAKPVEFLPFVPWLFGIIIVNTGLDYYLNRDLYFPALQSRKGIRTVFVAASFSNAIEPKGFNPRLRRLIEGIHEVLRSLHIQFHSAHVEEQFGEAVQSPEGFGERDIKHLTSCDLVVALVTNPLSGGVHIELGWASFLQKHIIMLVPHDFELSKDPMLSGLCTLADSEIVRFKDVHDMREKLRGQLQQRSTK